MNTNKHVIWGDISLDYEEWRHDLQGEYPNMSDNELYKMMGELNSEYLDDTRDNLDIQFSTAIIVVGDIERWNGRVSGYKMIESGNLKDCFFSDCDMNEWYVDKNGQLCCTAIHHDGANHYMYRAFKDTATDIQVGNLQAKIYKGLATRADITRLTKRLGDKIADTLGFELSSRSSQKAVQDDWRTNR